MTEMSFADGVKKFSEYGLGEFLEIVGELSQESAKKGALDRTTKELITLAFALAKCCHRCVEIHSREGLKLGASEDEIGQVKRTVFFLNAAPWHDDMMINHWSASWRYFTNVAGPIVSVAVTEVQQCLCCSYELTDHKDLILVLNTR